VIELKKIDSVKEIPRVFGIFGILMKMKSSATKLLNMTVSQRIQKIGYA